jgi:hypothetical protein
VGRFHFWPALLCLVVLSALPLPAWGPRGHELVNQHAIATLPPELRAFFEAQREWLVANASAPDDWRDDDPTEDPHHFIDIERYARKFEKLPDAREIAIERLGADYVQESGDVIWWLPHATHQLAAAMRAGNREEILRWSVALRRRHLPAPAHHRKLRRAVHRAQGRPQPLRNPGGEPHGRLTRTEATARPVLA